jgi:hypothetical protein
LLEVCCGDVVNFWRKCGEAHLWFRARKGYDAIVDPDFSELFGFTEKDIENALQKLPFCLSRAFTCKLLNRFRFHHNRYHFHFSSEELYNPTRILFELKSIAEIMMRKRPPPQRQRQEATTTSTTTTTTTIATKSSDTTTTTMTAATINAEEHFIQTGSQQTSPPNDDDDDDTLTEEEKNYLIYLNEELENYKDLNSAQTESSLTLLTRHPRLEEIISAILAGPVECQELMRRFKLETLIEDIKIEEGRTKLPRAVVSWMFYTGGLTWVPPSIAQFESGKLMQIPNNVARMEYLGRLVFLLNAKFNRSDISKLKQSFTTWIETFDISKFIKDVSRIFFSTTSPKVRKGDRSAIEGEDVFAQSMSTTTTTTTTLSSFIYISLSIFHHSLNKQNNTKMIIDFF